MLSSYNFRRPRIPKYKKLEEVRQKFNKEKKNIVNFVQPPAIVAALPGSPSRQGSVLNPETPQQSTTTLLSRLGEYTTERVLPGMIGDSKDETYIRQILISLIDDDKDIAALDEIAAERDLDFIGSYNIGKYAEIYVSLNMRCPCCGEKSLKLFRNPNMPVIDLVCINPIHDQKLGPRLWQVKASKTDTYFSLDNRFITVGSRNWGNYVHLDDAEVDIRIGYICLKVDDVHEFDKKVNLRKSFVIYPPNNLYVYEEKNNVLLNYNRDELYKNHEAIRWSGDVFSIQTYLDVIPGFEHFNFNMDKLLSYIEEPIIIVSDENTNQNEGAAEDASSAMEIIGGNIYNINYINPDLLGGVESENESVNIGNKERTGSLGDSIYDIRYLKIN